jgi:hypothetical protein
LHRHMGCGTSDRKRRSCPRGPTHGNPHDGTRSKGPLPLACNLPPASTIMPRATTASNQARTILMRWPSPLVTAR